jgi:hypothetical protein
MEKEQQEYMSGKRAALNIIMFMAGTVLALLLLKYLLGM